MASKFGSVMLLFISIFIFFGFSYNPNTSGVKTGSGPSGFKRYSYYDNSRIKHKNVFTISFLEPEYDRFIFPKADKISNRGNMLRTSRIKTFINNHAPNQIVRNGKQIEIMPHFFLHEPFSDGEYAKHQKQKHNPVSKEWVNTTQVGYEHKRNLSVQVFEQLDRNLWDKSIQGERENFLNKSNINYMGNQIYNDGQTYSYESGGLAFPNYSLVMKDIFGMTLTPETNATLDFKLTSRKVKYYLGEFVPLKININNQGGDELAISDIKLILEDKNSGKIETQGLPNRGQSEMVILPGENYLEIILNNTITFKYYSEYHWPIVPVGDYHLYLIHNGEKISNSVDLTVLPNQVENIDAFEALNLNTLTYLEGTKICLQAYDGLKLYENSIFQYEHYIRAVNDFVIPVATTLHDHKEFVVPAQAILKKYLELREFDNYAYEQLLRMREMNINFENEFIDSLVVEYERRKKLSEYSGNKIAFRFKD